MEYDFTKDIDYVAYEDFLRKYSRHNLQLAERTFKLYRELNTPGKKDIFDILILSDLFARPPFSDDIEEFGSVIGTLESLRASGQLEQVMNVLSFFMMQQKDLYERKLSIQKKAQTRSATHKRQATMVTYCRAVEEYLQKVEDIWHPQEDTQNQQRNARNNKKNAIERVYRDNAEKIFEKLKECGVQDEFKKQFFNCFIFYTKMYVKLNEGKTRNGHIPEKRAARSEKSKARTSKAMKSLWEKTRKK